MARPDHDYLTGLAVHLRLVGMDSAQIGAVLEETRDHLDASGEDPEENFVRASDFAEALAGSQDVTLPRRPLQLTPGDLALSVLAVIAGFVALATLWDDPLLVTVPPWAAIVIGAGLLAGAWIRVWRLRDPVHPPTSESSSTDG
jgi:hypothetical protein